MAVSHTEGFYCCMYSTMHCKAFGQGKLGKFMIPPKRVCWGEVLTGIYKTACQVYYKQVFFVLNNMFSLRIVVDVVQCA